MWAWYTFYRLKTTPIKCLQINNSDKLYTSSSNNTNYNDDIKIIRYFVPTL